MVNELVMICFIEEMSELQKILCKILRFNISKYRNKLVEEISDVRYNMRKICSIFNITNDELSKIDEKKRVKF